jgi:metallo-beta-lactamase class B
MTKFKCSILSTLFLLIITSAFSQPPLSIKKVATGLYVFTTYNTYKGEKYPANGLYAVTPKGVILVDCPWDTTQFQPLLDSIRKLHDKRVVACIATHSHADRTAGLTYYQTKGIKTYTSQRTDSICRATNAPRAQYFLPNDTSIYIGGIKMRIFFAGEGHTPDNIVVWFPQTKLLYGGCLIKSTEATSIGNIADANLKAYPHTLKKLQQVFPNPRYIIPGHEGWKNTKSIEHTLALLKKLNKP